MDAVNFLNKKYTSIHNTLPLAQSRSRSSRTFMPSHLTHANHNQTHTEMLTGLALAPDANHLISNHCTEHPQ